MEGQISWHGDVDEVAAALRSWADTGATHVAINTMGAGLRTVDDHLAALTSAAKVANNVVG